MEQSNSSQHGELINFCFNGWGKGFIGTTRYGAIWTNNQEKYRMSFDKTSLKLAINYLLDNCYFALCFHQILGILKMSDPESFIVKLFLYHLFDME